MVFPAATIMANGRPPSVSARRARSTRTDSMVVSVDNHPMAHLENFRLKVFRAVAEHLTPRNIFSLRSLR